MTSGRPLFICPGGWYLASWSCSSYGYATDALHCSDYFDFPFVISLADLPPVAVIHPCHKTRHESLSILQTMNTLRLHYLLRYHLEQSQRAPLHWDMHDPPTSARYHLPRTLPTATLSPEDLEMPATEPPVISLHIICDVLPCNSPIVARNFSGVTIHDVLFAIYKTLQVQINSAEWSALAKKQQDRINRIFEGRQQRSDNSPTVHSAGIKVVDSLLYHFLFAGLTPITFPAPEATCVLTLRRAQPASA